ncbi:bifunctional methylenetetrahydrofolate dehydrogenase/methenyltetrahydrofolate cyclohydrolase FolD [Metabacillus sp. GX 13764]|uniref:bifunctional methylenetetrahydrofolate dehydrogenase/methenyltetrahydrofolate cyclohydrolase FolD n=1 Tax=Metabacillus kandeliae TaxID=2900151 RepID=UPI001E3D604B|nr:bifunctional methylenetetrahydrofolate dehydrogenase/methenyltetrahydrofolate cyclohydrolase FolD [Metabacillus kandeliae]MCD7033208.1 bifunctional methylenetetrahydrofolate dehydrogenase/methenyltetrahydrofolate cyclohydrolase FolD [Metabacillus kandeliae]
MTAKIINGKEISKQKRSELALEVESLKEKGICPGLAIILVGDSPASLSYIKGKQKAAEEIGLLFKLEHFSGNISEDFLLEVIDQYNQDDRFHGILVQLPLPAHINELHVIDRILPEKDVDGFHPINVGKLVTGQEGLVSCTPAGIIEMLKIEGVQLSGKHAVVVGRSNIVGKPIAQLLLKENATVTTCHSKTADLSYYTKQADILIVAIGRANLIKGSDVKKGAAVIDVGMNRLDSGKLTGDVLFDEAKEQAGFITPVPGGVGPMTITMLADNTVKAAKMIEAGKMKA